MKLKMPSIGTWLRLAAMLACIVLLPILLRIPDDINVFFILNLGYQMLFFPVFVIAITAWDGAKHGFNLMWVICIILFWIPAIILYYNNQFSMMYHVVPCAILAGIGNAIAAFLTRHSRNHTPSGDFRQHRALSALDLLLRILVGIAVGAAVGLGIHVWHTYFSGKIVDGKVIHDPNEGIQAMLAGVIVAVVVAVSLSVARYRRIYVEEQMNHRLQLATQSQEFATKVHDSISHALVQISILSDTKDGEGDTGDREHLRQIHELSAQGLGEIRDLVAELQTQSKQWSSDGNWARIPAGTSWRRDTQTTQPVDFATTLQDFVDCLQRSGFTFDLQIRGNLAEVPADKVLVLGECLREVSTNVLKHADSNHPVILLLRIDTGKIHLYCANQINPQDPVFPSTSQGLVGIRQRVEQHGGTVTTSTDDGTWSLNITL